MRTVLIAHGNARFASEIAKRLSSRGYHTTVCPGPWPPQRCIRCDVGYCPLTEGADLMIYDPGLVGHDWSGGIHNLAMDSARAHPDVPLLLAYQGDESHSASDWVEGGWPAEQASSDPDKLLVQVSRLIGGPFAPGAAKTPVRESA